jgi:DNA-binding GntR family transcriptional regulator
MTTAPATEAYDRLLALLLAGTWAPQTPLREESLASMLGTSRTPVRDALRRLEGDGLVQITPRRGARVVGYSAGEIDSIYDLRAVLEGLAARWAAERGDVDLDAMTGLADQMERRAAEGERHEIGRLNLAFHGLVHDQAGNPLLTRTLQHVIATALVHGAFLAYSPEELARSFGHHRELVDALRARDGAWAESVMVAHIRAAHTVVQRTRALQERP